MMAVRAVAGAPCPSEVHLGSGGTLPQSALRLAALLTFFGSATVVATKFWSVAWGAAHSAAVRQARCSLRGDADCCNVCASSCARSLRVAAEPGEYAPSPKTISSPTV